MIEILFFSMVLSWGYSEAHTCTTGFQYGSSVHALEDWVVAGDSLPNSHATVARVYQEGELSCSTPFFRDPFAGARRWPIIAPAPKVGALGEIGIHYIHVDNIRTVQELLGHADVSTTMIYTHVLNKPGVTVTSPLDLLDR